MRFGRQLPGEPAHFIPVAERVVFFALLMLVFVAPLTISHLTHIDLIKWTIITIAGPVLAVTWIVSRTLTERLQIRVDAILVLAIASLVVLAMSLFAAVNPWLSLVDLVRRFALVCVFFTVAHAIIKDKDRDALLWAITAVGGIASIYGIAQHLGYDFFPWAEHSEIPVERGVSFFAHATFAASFLIMAIPVGIGLAVTRTSLPSGILAFIPVLLMLYHLSFSGARSASAALFASAMVLLGFFLLEERGGTRRGLRFGAVILAVIVILAGSFFAWRAWSIKGSDLFGMRQASVLQRLWAWETASRIFAEHPLTGIGAGNYEVVSPAYWNEVEANRYANYGRMFFQVHNEYLETAAEQGIPGLAVFLALIAVALAASATIGLTDPRPKNRRIALALFAALFASSLDAVLLFNHQQPASALLFWVMLGILSHTASRPPAAEEVESG